MEGFGIDKLILILVIVLVFFGAKRVPEIGASFGKGIREFKRGLSDLGDDAPEPPAPTVQGVVREASVDDARPEPKRLLHS